MRRYFYYILDSEVSFLKKGQVFLSEKHIAENWDGRPLKKGEVGSMTLYDKEENAFKHVEVKYLGYADFKDEKDLHENGIEKIEEKLKEFGLNGEA